MILYRRPLPSPPAVAFDSPEGRVIFKEALEKGTMECFFPLISQFVTQNEPAFCGLSSLAMVLNALEIDPGKVWKGSWRWFDESKLDCCEPLHVVEKQGIVFSKVVCLAQCNGAHVLHHALAENSTEETFRQHIRDSVTAHNSFIIASYSRKGLGQTGDGHFSPIGGYHAERDLVLILDVARFKYPPHWVSVSLLWKAMRDFKDPTTGKSRGFMHLTRHKPSSTKIFALTLKESGLDTQVSIETRRLIKEGLAHLHKPHPLTDKELVSFLLSSLPSNVRCLVALINPLQPNGPSNQQYVPEVVEATRRKVMDQIKATPLYEVVQAVNTSSEPDAAVLYTVFLYTLMCKDIVPTLQMQLRPYAHLFTVDTIGHELRGEIKELRSQLKIVLA